MATRASVRRPGLDLDQPSPWFIKGSYVLMVLFDRGTASDVDVFYLRGGRLDQAEVEALLREQGWPTRGIDPTPVNQEDFDQRAGGGETRFNIDLWHIGQDGQFYRRDEHSNTLIPLNHGEAIGEQLRLLDGQHVPSAYTEEDRLYLEKVLRKMDEHPSLNSPTIRETVEYELAVVDDPPDQEPGAQEPFVTDLDEDGG
ncbi:MAG TPA: hypothetical protein VLC09_03770 [Polyangiaceae bacterium]|nr:hypothetical protein [Polyangiaceae bacterium]